MSKPQNTMARDALIFLPAKIVEGILLMLVTALYAKLFTTDAVGLFRYVNVSVQFSYLILCGWMANTASRYIGDETASDKGRLLYSTIGSVYLIISLIASVLCFVFFLITKQGLFLAFILMFISYAAFQILNAMLVQLGKIRASIVLSLASASLKLLVAYLLVGGSAGHDTAYPAVFAAASADGVAAISAIFVLGIPALFSVTLFSKPLLKKFLRFGLPLMGVSISVGLLNVVDTYIIGFFSGKSKVAIYGQNYTIGTSIFTMINVAIMRGVYPNLLRTYRTGGSLKAKPLLDQGVRLYLLIALPAAAGLCAISTALCTLLFPAEYLPGAPIIGLTAVAMVLMGLTEYANKAYELESTTFPILQNSLVAALIKILCSILFLHIFGIVGVAYGTVLSFGVYFMVTVARVRKRFLFRVAPSSLLRIIGASVCCFAAAFFSRNLFTAIVPSLLFSILCGGTAYVSVLFITGEIKQELLTLQSKFFSSK